MGSIIKPLPEAVWSSVRSGIVLYDLTKVVEELVYNSLDAGATKVHVAVSAGTFLVKVLDNGYGINRDGLVLLGERYATSRFQQLTDFETCGSFGFRGEALCSIADVSLLEVITKTQGMPHGYRKILKGRKCLYIGIEDEKLDVGTTVVVRDLFYNQPVRRRQIQSSPKKLLHSVKKCVLRIALVHSSVSFRVADIESDDVLLATSPCPSPLQLLSSNFGIEASNSMNELKAFEGGIKLFGYISGPFGVLSLKALQYIYINSRFVCKGPIHKMLNQLAAGYEDGKFNKLLRNEKRSRLQTFPTFVLNLSCPRSLYDISFEPSKNLVEFRDWDPILTFVKNAVMRIWSESVSDGKTYSPDLPMNYEVGIKRQRTQKWQASVDDCDIPSYQRKRQSSCRKPNGDAPELVNNLTESSAVASGSVSSFCSGPAKDSKSHPHMESYDEIMCADNSNKQVDHNIGSRWQIESFEDEGSMRKMSTSTALSNDCYSITKNTYVNQDFEKQYQFSPLRRGNLLHYGASLSTELGDQFACDNFAIRQKWMGDDDDDIATEKGKDFEYLLRQHDVKPRWSFSKCTKFQKIRSNSSLSLQEKMPPLLFDEFSSEDFPSFLKDVESCSSYLQPSTTGWISLESGPIFSPRTPNVDNFVGEYDHCKRGNRYTHFPDDEDCNFTEERVVDGWPQENCPGSSFSDFSWDQELGTSSWSENGQICRHKSNISFLPSCSNTVAGEQEYGHLHLPFEERLVESFDLLNDPLLSAQSNREKCGAIWTRNEEAASPFKMGSGRSQSAPPFHRHRKKYSSSIDMLEMGTAVHSNVSLTEASNLDPEHCTESIKPDHELFNPSCFSLMPSYVDDSLPAAELSTKRTPESLEIQNADRRRQREFVDDSVKDFALREVEDIFEPGLKWRSHCPETEYGGSIDNIEDHHPILNISSGILHLAGDSLVPNYIDKNSLKDARVLQQVDKKFIPIIAGGTLSLIDQHAADERIRLEELQQKVLSGEMKQSSYLEDEQELVLPEFGYQLLHNYSEQIQHWGWICNFSTECSSRPFTKSLNALHRQPTVAKLVAVPCILGVNLTDVDLLEFLQQLADTDGSSTVPPSVHRVLNNKACRGAIMFGDTLLPSECSLIVEELKQTSLCFQCAHGRPTTVPIVNLEALHKQISKLGLSSRSQQESWHGLQRYQVSLSRAAHRLSSALDFD